MTSLKKNFKTMLTGTVLSQLIPIVSTPLLTRVFSPDDFGVFAFYLSIVIMICAFNSGKYEQSINLTETEEESDSLLFGTLIIILASTVLLYIIIGLISFIEIEELNKIGKFIWILPISAALLSTYQALTYWHNRKSDFKRISKNLSAQSLVNVTSSLILGIIGIKSGLIIGDLFAKLYSSISLMGSLKDTSWSSVKKNYIKYIDSPKFLVPATLLNASSKQLPIIVFGMLFLPKTIGFLLIAQRVFQSPIGIISQSLSQVLLNRMSSEYRDEGNCKNTFNKSFLFLALLPTPAIFIVYFFIDPLVAFVFGSEWKDLGLLIKILFPFYYIYFIAGTLNIVLIAFGKKKIHLTVQLVYFISTMILIFLCYILKLDSIEAISLYSITGSISFLIALGFSYKVSRGAF